MISSSHKQDSKHFPLSDCYLVLCLQITAQSIETLSQYPQGKETRYRIGDPRALEPEEGDGEVRGNEAIDMVQNK